MPFHKILNEYREKLRIMAKEHGTQIVDLQSEFDKAQKSIKPKELATDGIHPTNLGHKIIAAAVLKQIKFT